MTQKTNIPRSITLDTNVIKTDKKITKNKIINFVYLIICGFIIYKLGIIAYNKKIAVDSTKKAVACPALLSISRSARDTFIVMKAETLCNEYVLETFE